MRSFEVRHVWPVKVDASNLEWLVGGEDFAQKPGSSAEIPREPLEEPVYWELAVLELKCGVGLLISKSENGGLSRLGRPWRCTGVDRVEQVWTLYSPSAQDKVPSPHKGENERFISKGFRFNCSSMNTLSIQTLGTSCGAMLQVSCTRLGIYQLQYRRKAE